MRHLLAAALVLTGCFGPSPNAQLADLPVLEIDVIVPMRPQSNGDTRHELEIALEHDDDEFSAANYGACATLGAGTRAYFDGQALELTEPGYYDDGSIDCVHPRFSGLVEVELGAHRLELVDDSHRVLATFEPGTEPRVATPLTRPDWDFTAGETIVFRWSHVDDLSLSLYAHYFLADGSGYDFRNVHVVGSEIHLDLPVGHPIGDGVLELAFAKFGDGLVFGAAATCDGASACRWSQRRSIQHDATISP